MSSFFADTLAVIAHQPDTVFAVLSVSRPIMNSSVVPVALSRDAIWDALVSKPDLESKQEKYYKLFLAFCDTVQFTKKIRFRSASKPPGDDDDDDDDDEEGYEEEEENEDDDDDDDDEDEATEEDKTPSSAHQFLSDVVLKLKKTRYFTSTVEHLDFSSSSSPGALEAILCRGTAFRNVRSIGLGPLIGNLEYRHLDLISRSLPSLEKLDLNCQVGISDRALNTALPRLSALRSLDLSLSSVASLSFLKDLKRLETLTLQSCRKLTEKSFDFGGAKNNNMSKGLLPSLTELTLEWAPSLIGGSSTLANVSKIIDTALHQFQIHATHLTSLSCSFAGKEGCIAVAGMKRLRKLRMIDCYAKATAKDADPFKNSFKKIMSSLSHLEEIDLAPSVEVDAPFADNTLRSIAESASSSSIRVVMLSAQDLTDKGVMMMSRLLPSMKNLESLLLKSCSKLSDQGVKALLSVTGDTGIISSSLKRLELSKCTNLSSEGLLSAFETSNCKESLEELNVSGCKGLTDLKFLKDLRSLKKFDIGYAKLNYKSMKTADGFDLLPTTLEALILPYSGALSDLALTRIPEAILRNLKSLDVNGCKHLTNRCLVQTVSKMINLEHLDIGHGSERKSTFTLDKEGIETVVEKLRHLKVIVLSEELMLKIDQDPILARKFGHLVTDEEELLVQHENIYNE